MKAPRIDIHLGHGKIVSDILRRHVPQYEVWAFGSRVRWTAKQYSDLDLAVITDRPLSLAVSASLTDDFSESDLPFKVDVVDWATTSESFRKIIERDRVVVQQAGAKAGSGVAGEWSVATVAECAANEPYSTQIGPFGEKIRAEIYTPEGAPILRGTNVNTEERFHDADFVFMDSEIAEKEFSKFVCEADDVILCHKGTLGKIGIIPKHSRYKRYVMGNRMMKVRCDRQKLEPSFLYYWLTSQDGQDYLFSRVSQVGVPQLQRPLTTLREATIPLPPLPEQRAIARILGTLDDKIELNRRLNETLEAMARALFKSWFVDFDPVRAKAEGRDPGLPKPLADLFPARLVDSELGEIPEGWHIKRIEEVAERVAMGPFGASIKVETFVPDGVPIISGQHLRGFVLEDSAFNFITPAHAKRLANANVQRGDVVFTHAGNIGQAAFIPESSRYERYVISQRQFYMRCDRSQVSPTFIAFYFGSAEGRHRLLANTSSSGVPSIARPVTFLRTIPLAIPTYPILAAFERQTSPIVGRFLKNVQINVTLTTLRDSLLPKLISGELRVKEAENFVGSVA